MEITDLDNLASCDGASLIARVAAAVEASCSAGGLRGDVFGAIDEVLEGENWLDLSDLESNCPCMYDIIRTQLQGNSGMCNSLGIFETESSPGRVRFTYGVPNNGVVPQNFFEQRPAQPAQTSFDLSGNTIIMLNPGMCDGTFGVGAPRIVWNNYVFALIPVHEGYHAQIYSYIFSQGITFDLAGSSRFYELQDAILGHIGCGPSNDQQHTYFLRDLLFEFAAYLREADGNRYDLDYYVWFAGSDLFLRNRPNEHVNTFNPCAVGFYGQTTIEDWRSKAEFVLNQMTDQNGDGQLELNDLLLPTSCN